MPNVSSITTVLPLRVPNELMERLEAMVELLGEKRNDVGREALERGLAQLEEQHASQKAQRSRRKRSAPAAVETAAAPASTKRPKRPKPAAQSISAEPVQGLTPEQEEALSLFAAQVLESAKRCPTGRFGDDRIFINHVWRQYKRDWKPKGMDLEAFKQQLLEANRRRYLSIVRADMAPKLDQKDVKESEIRYLSATFNFVCF